MTTSPSSARLIGLIPDDWSREYRAGIPDVVYLQTLNAIAGGIRDMVRQAQDQQRAHEHAGQDQVGVRP